MTESHDSHPLPRCYFDIIRGQSVYPMYATAKEATPNYKCSLNFRTHAHGIHVSCDTDSRREMRWPGWPPFFKSENLCRTLLPPTARAPATACTIGSHRTRDRPPDRPKNRTTGVTPLRYHTKRRHVLTDGNLHSGSAWTPPQRPTSLPENKCLLYNPLLRNVVPGRIPHTGRSLGKRPQWRLERIQRKVQLLWKNTPQHPKNIQQQEPVHRHEQ